jgi:hypothetical protein
MKKLIVVMLSVACFMACKTDNSKAVPSVGNKAEAKMDTTQARTYVCPMDADITSNKADEKCSKCGMKLVEKK